MFRGSKPSDISPKNFGAGSIIEGAPRESWLVINCADCAVKLVNLQTYELLDGSVDAPDPNHLTEPQARKLVGLIDNGYTFSDYTLYPVGIKHIEFAKA